MSSTDERRSPGRVRTALRAFAFLFLPLFVALYALYCLAVQLVWSLGGLGDDLWAAPVVVGSALLAQSVGAWSRSAVLRRGTKAVPDLALPLAQFSALLLALLVSANLVQWNWFADANRGVRYAAFVVPLVGVYLATSGLYLVLLRHRAMPLGKPHG
jgi:hypothetical protein